MGESMGDHSWTICLSLLRKIDVYGAKLELFTSIGSKSTFIKDLDAWSLFNEALEREISGNQGTHHARIWKGCVCGCFENPK